MGNILLGLVPALMWGIQPLVMQKIGGRPTNQQMGMGIGALLFSTVVLIFHQPAVWSANLIISSLICGFFWAFGQIYQIKGFHMIGVSRAMPISSGTQLIGTSLVGVLYFHEWTSGMQYVIGICALVLVIGGISMTSFQEKVAGGRSVDMKKGLITLLISSLGFVFYVVTPRIANVDGWDALFPQGVGMFLGAVLFCTLEKEKQLFGVKSLQNIATGLVFAIANITIMLSNEVNGVAIGFTLSQMNVIVATLGGLILLHERKTSKEMKYTLIGLLLVVAGGILIGMTK